MQIQLFENYHKHNKPLIYMAFDVDDNLLHMKTRIHMENLVDGKWVTKKIDSELFAKVRVDTKNWRFKPNDDSFIEFRDIGPMGDDTFLYDFKHAIKTKNFGPSWSKFIECLVNGYLFAIITSRGHDPKNIKKAIYWLIYEYGLNHFKYLNLKNVDKYESLEDQMINNLLNFHELFGTDPDYVIDEYLDLCPVYTVSSKNFIKRFGIMPVETSKKLALREFTNAVKRYANKLGVKAKLGFSDDDPRFVKSAIDEFTNLKIKHKNIEYSVFDTGGRNLKKIDL